MADFDKSNFDPKAAAEARKAELEEITAKLEKGVKDIFTSDGYQKYLNFCARLPRYSVNNQILIMLQKPDASMCQSFGGWKEMNRFVKRGEKGIRILAPSPYKMEREQEKTDEAGNVIFGANGEPVKEKVEVTINAFKPVSTFDISQTEGEPVPTPGVDELTASVEGYDTFLAAIEDVVPVPISFEQIGSGAKGYFHLTENRIVVQEGMSEAQTVKTLLHEACHQALHSREAKDASNAEKSKSQKETEAESVAYVVCQHYGVDTSDYSFAYLATWAADKDVPELKASLDTIRGTASDFIVKLDEKLEALAKSKAMNYDIEQDIPNDMGKAMEACDEELLFDNPASEEPAKRMSVKEKLAAGKEMSEKTRSSDRPLTLDIREAI